MIIAKLVLFASPILAAFIFFVANPAVASSIDSASATTHLHAASVHPVNSLVILARDDKSNPILDQLSCKCSYCVQAQLELEGKLSISDILSN
ncbi:MAG: hypothetical protein AAF915_18540 [Cyanobacteria bacterium P01_D01_bin.50]